MCALAVVSPGTNKVKYVTVIGNNSATVAVGRQVFHRIKTNSCGLAYSGTVSGQPVLCGIFNDHFIIKHPLSPGIHIAHVCNTGAVQSNQYYGLITDILWNFFNIKHTVVININKMYIPSCTNKRIGSGRIGKTGH